MYNSSELPEAAAGGGGGGGERVAGMGEGGGGGGGERAPLPPPPPPLSHSANRDITRALEDTANVLAAPDKVREAYLNF